MGDLCLDNLTSLTFTNLYTLQVSERAHYLNTSHSFIYVLSVRDVALSKHRSLIYIRPKCHRSRII
jgi:hypothetical protein